LRDEISADGAAEIDVILEGGIAQYRDIRIRRSDVLRLWPTGGTAPASQHLKRTVGPQIFTMTIDENTRKIGDFPVVCAVTLKNTSEQAHDVLVKMVNFTGASIRDMPQPFVLRTENQILDGRSGAFRLRPSETKTIPILFRDPIRAPDWSFLDEHGRRHATAASAFKMLLGVYSDTSSRKFKLVCDVDAGWKIYAAKVTLVPEGYVLNSNWPD
jgi:hypothetical protein